MNKIVVISIPTHVISCKVAKAKGAERGIIERKRRIVQYVVFIGMFVFTVIYKRKCRCEDLVLCLFIVFIINL